MRACVSISANPGVLGTLIHGDFYARHGLDYVYQALCVGPAALGKAIGFVRKNDVAGCSVSAPHKVNVLCFVDEVSSDVERIGSLNSIVNVGGVLVGHNTDYLAARCIAASCSVRDVFILGKGGLARAIEAAFIDEGCTVTLVGRFDDKHVHTTGGAYAFVNATPVGMNHNDDVASIVGHDVIDHADVVIDGVAKNTKLLSHACISSKPKRVVSGYALAALQAVIQCSLYTGIGYDEHDVAHALQLMREQAV